MFPKHVRQLFEIRGKSKAKKRHFSNRRRFIEHLENRNLLAAAINVIPGASGSGDHDANLLDDGQILFGDPDAGANTLSTGALLEASDAQSVLLQALSISFDDLGGVLAIATTGNDVSLSTDTAGGGDITFDEVSNTLELAGGNLTFAAGGMLSLGNLDTTGGNLDLSAGGQGSGTIDVGSIDTSDANGMVSLAASDAINLHGELNAGSDLVVSNAAAAALNLASGANVSSGGAIDLSDVIEIVTGVGTSAIDGADNVVVAPVRSGDAGLTDLSITSGGNLNVSSIDLSNAGADLALESTGGNIVVAADRISGSGVEFDPTNEPNVFIFDSINAGSISMTTDGGDITLEVDIAQSGGLAVTATSGDIVIDTDGGTTTLDDARDNAAIQPEDRNAWTILRTTGATTIINIAGNLDINNRDNGFDPPALGSHPQVVSNGTVTLGEGASSIAIGNQAVVNSPGGSPVSYSDTTVNEISADALAIGNGVANEVRLDMNGNYSGPENLTISANGAINDNDDGGFALRAASGVNVMLTLDTNGAIGSDGIDGLSLDVAALVIPSATTVNIIDAQQNHLETTYSVNSTGNLTIEHTRNNDSIVIDSINIGNRTADITSTNGDILDNESDAGANVDIVATTANLVSRRGITDIETQVSNLSATATSSGDISVTNSGGALRVTNADTNNGSIAITNDANIDIDTVVSQRNGTTIEITSTAGAILGDAGSTQITGDLLALLGATGVGTLNRPVRTEVRTVAASATGGVVSVSNSSDLAVGTAGTLTGISTIDSHTSLVATGSIDVNESINTASGNLLLESTTSSVDQDDDGHLIVGGLLIRALTADLPNDGNMIGQLAASLNGPSLTVGNGTDLEIEQVSVGSASQNGIQGIATDTKLSVTGNLAINADIDLVGGSLLIDADGNVTQGTGDILDVNGLALMIDGTTTLTEPNQISTLAIDAHDTVEVSSELQLNIDGLSVDGMTVTGISSSSDDVKVTSSAEIQLSQNVDLSDGTLLLVADFTIDQLGGSIVAGGVGLMSSDSVTVDSATNDMNILAVDADGTVTVLNNSDLTIGSITAGGMTASGITSSDNDVEVAIAGSLDITSPIDVGIAALALLANGDVTQQSGGDISGDALLVDAASVDLSDAQNDVELFAAAASSGTVQFADLNSLIIGSVTGPSTFLDGILTTDSGVKITAGDAMDIEAPITAGTGDVLLSSGANLTQDFGGLIEANGLALMVDGATDLTADALAVSQLAANTTGVIDVVTSSDLTIATLDILGMVTDGLTTDNNDARITTSGSVAIDAAVDVGNADLEIQAVDISQTAGNSIASSGLVVLATGVMLQDANNSFSELALLASDNAFVNTMSSLAIVEIEVIDTTSGGILNQGGDTKITSAGDIDVEDAIETLTNNVLLMAGGSVAQTADGIIQSAGLALMASGSVTLAEENDVDLLAADVDGEVILVDNDDVTISELTVDSMTVTGVNSNDNDIQLKTSTLNGAPLDITQPLNAGSGNLYIVSESGSFEAVRQTADGHVTAASVGIQANGVICLCLAQNDIDSIAATSSGSTIEVSDVDDLTVTDVAPSATDVIGYTATSGIDSDGSDINLRTALNGPGSLHLNAPLTSFAGTVRLVSVNETNDAITQSDDGAILGVELGILTAGDVYLKDADNDVGTLAVNSTGGPIIVDFFDVNNFLRGDVFAGGECGFTGAFGIDTNGGAVDLERGEAVKLVAVGADAGGGPHVRVFNQDGSERFSFFAYDSGFFGGVRVATGDVTGDGVDDIVTSVGPTGGPHIRVFDGNDLSLVTEFNAYHELFFGGVYVTVGDVDADGFADIITGPDETGGPHVAVFDRDGVNTNNYLAYDPAFVGGVRVAAGDINNDRFDDIITGAGPGGGPHVTAISGADDSILQSFLAFDASSFNGVYVAAGDINGMGAAEIIVSSTADTTINVFEGDNGNGNLVDSFFADPNEIDPIALRLTTFDFNNNGRDEILTSRAAGRPPEVDVFDGLTFDEIDNFFAYDPLFLGGVFVGG